MRSPLPALLALLGVGLALTTGPALAQADSSLPNVVVILADDMGWADLGHDGSGIDTPHLDRLAADGVKLTQFYAAAPICSPTRAALLTGRYPHSVGVPALANPAERGGLPVLALDPDAVTLPEALGPHGYHSALVGKWHLGYAREHWPRTHGFDEFWGSLIGTPGFWAPLETYRNETPIEVHDYFTDAITDEAVAYLERRATAGRPFFLYLAYNAPHYPLEAPAELVYKYRRRMGDEAGLFALYAAMVEQMDHGIGRVLEALDRLGIAENTLVIFTSDNGPSAEPKSYGMPGARRSAGPLRGAKFSTYEGGLRVPFLARWPGRLPAGALVHTPASTMDVLPTVLDAAGLPPLDAAHGQSLLSLLQGEPFAPAEALHWETRFNLGVRAGEWKLVHQFWNEQPALYHLPSDPAEQRDLAARYPEKVLTLQRLHEAWKGAHYPDSIPPRQTRSGYHFPE